MIPFIGFGTYRVTDQKVIKNAIQKGYNHFDTAELYQNERMVKEAIDKYATSKIYVTTKISKKSIHAGKISDSFNERLAIFPYIDILLLHVPSKDCKKDWEELCDLYKKNTNRIGFIGVSNYDIEHIEQIKNCSIQPWCNQIELSPFYTRNHLVEYLRSKNIIIISHTTLTRKEKFGNEILHSLSKKYGVSVANILLKWALYNKYIVIPKTCSEEHMIENKNIIPELEYNDNQLLNSLNENFHITKISY